jgi:hypothetical protein
VYRETLGKTVAMEGETKSKTVAKENKAGSQPGLPGSPGFRVDPPGRPGFTGPTPERVFASTRTGPRPGLTRRAGPGFKTLAGSVMPKWLEVLHPKPLCLNLIKSTWHALLCVVFRFPWAAHTKFSYTWFFMHNMSLFICQWQTITNIFMLNNICVNWIVLRTITMS